MKWSVNLRMTIWCLQFSKKTTQKFDEYLPQNLKWLNHTIILKALFQANFVKELQSQNFGYMKNPCLLAKCLHTIKSMGDICKYNNFSDSLQLIFHKLVQHKARKKRGKKPPTALIHSVLERSQKWIRDIHEK